MKIVKWHKHTYSSDCFGTIYDLRGSVGKYEDIFCIWENRPDKRKFSTKWTMIWVVGIHTKRNFFPTQRAAKAQAEILALKYLFNIGSNTI